jgi:hypothetical protein
LKGAGAGFGIITEFVVKTHPEPAEVVQFSYSLTFGHFSEMTSVLQRWQTLISDPELDRRFGTELVVLELGIVITGTFYGTEKEFYASGIPCRIPTGKVAVVIDDWLAVIAQEAENAALYLSDTATQFTARSFAFRRDELLSVQGITDLMNYIGNTRHGTISWFMVFDASGGAVGDIAMNATAYSHRDKIMFAQAYAIGIPTLSKQTRDFVEGMIHVIQESEHTNLTTYPGYVDPTLTNPQESYWGPNLAALERIKTSWDVKDLFHNPQSIRPAS